MMRIELEQRHIKQGHCGDATACALALAIQEKLPPGLDVCVKVHAIKFFKGGEMVFRLPTTKQMRRFIDDFDDYRPVHPFSFDLPLEGLLEGSK